MFSKFKKIATLLVCVLSSNSMNAMKIDDFAVAVRNNYGAQIEVIYNFQGDELKKVINENQNFILGPASKIKGEVKIYRAGEYMKYVAVGYSMQINGLAQIFTQQRRQHEDALLLTVTSSTGRLVINYRPTTEATLKQMRDVEKYEGDVIDQFPGLKKHGLQKTLTPARIRAIRTWKEEVIPAGWIESATTGEDIARYILGLPKEYTQASLESAYRALWGEWNPDNQHSPQMKDFARQVLQLINHAKWLLDQKFGEHGSN